MLHKHDRPYSMNGPLLIPTKSILTLCHFYELTDDDFHRILLIENIVYPIFLEKLKSKNNE